MKKACVSYHTKYNTHLGLNFWLACVTFSRITVASTVICPRVICENVTPTNTILKFLIRRPIIQMTRYSISPPRQIRSNLSSKCVFCYPFLCSFHPRPSFFKSGNRIKSNPRNKQNSGISRREQGMKMCLEGNKIDKSTGFKPCFLKWSNCTRGNWNKTHWKIEEILKLRSSCMHPPSLTNGSGLYV